VTDVSHPGSPIASIVITTRNRCEDTLRAIASCVAQDGADLEILVFDDESEDDTVAVVGRAFPQVRMFSAAQRTGYIVNRNRGFVEARGKYVFSLDDDAYFARTDIVSQVVGLFEADPTIGAIAIPYVEPLNRRSVSSLKSPFRSKPGDELRSYVGCSHAVRRDVALMLDGYRDFFVHQGEERDFCLRMWAAGLRVVYGGAGDVVHMVSPKRDSRRVSYYGARNQILFETLNVPFPEVLFRIVWVSQGMVRYRFSWSRAGAVLLGIFAGLAETIRRLGLRRPVGRGVYRAYLRAASHGPEALDGPPPPPCGKG
jgi:GT2 family glycosyltransferase